MGTKFHSRTVICAHLKSSKRTSIYGIHLRCCNGSCLPPMGDAFVSVDEFQDWIIYLSFKFDVQGFQHC